MHKMHQDAPFPYIKIKYFYGDSQPLCRPLHH